VGQCFSHNLSRGCQIWLVTLIGIARHHLFVPVQSSFTRQTAVDIYRILPIVTAPQRQPPTPSALLHDVHTNHPFTHNWTSTLTLSHLLGSNRSRTAGHGSETRLIWWDNVHLYFDIVSFGLPIMTYFHDDSAHTPPL
jgi:hypothetical protein